MSFMDNGGDYIATAVSQLMHLPETIERMVFDGDQDGGKRRSHHGSRQSRQQRQRVGEERGGVGSYPPVDVLEAPDSYVFYFDVPGLAKSDVQVAVEDEAMLLVRGGGGGGGGGEKRKREDVDDDEQQCRYLRLERRQLASTKFARKFRLPDDADPEKIAAKCEHGVLTVTVGKKRPEPEAEIKSKTVRVEIS